ncbi:MFS transporter [Nonomuraea sp. NPDC050202]|uniref:MFS transporter n=1 Tax=Nonomuraea sp. NPDC050202 TaxID=3155035 RepID=UPI0033EA2A77
MIRYRDLFAIGEFRYLYAGLALSYLGDKFAALAMTVLVFDRTQSSLLSGLAHASAFLPALLAGPLLGGLADRFRRRELMIVCDAARAILVGALLIPGMPIEGAIALLYIAALFSTPYMAARSALLPEILHGQASVTGNGLQRITYQLSQVVSFAVGGALLSVVEPEGALLFNSLTFSLSAALTAYGVLSRPAPASAGPRTSAPAGFRVGLRHVFGDPWLRNCLMLVWLVSACVHAPEAIVYPLAVTLGGAAPLAGMLLSATALGFATGAFLLTRVLTPSVRDRLIVPFAVVAGAALLPLITVPPTPVVIVLLFASGLGCGYSAPLNALFVQRVAPAYRGRAMGVAIAGLTGGQGLGFLLAGAFTAIGVPPAAGFTLCGAAAVVAALVAGRLWKRA